MFLWCATLREKRLRRSRRYINRPTCRSRAAEVRRLRAFDAARARRARLYLFRLYCFHPWSGARLTRLTTFAKPVPWTIFQCAHRCPGPPPRAVKHHQSQYAAAANRLGEFVVFLEGSAPARFSVAGRRDEFRPQCTDGHDYYRCRRFFLSPNVIRSRCIADALSLNIFHHFRSFNNATIMTAIVSRPQLLRAGECDFRALFVSSRLTLYRLRLCTGDFLPKPGRRVGHGAQLCD